MEKIILLNCVKENFQHIPNIEYVGEGLCYDDAIYSLEINVKKYNAKNVKYIYIDEKFQNVYYRKKWFGRLKFDANIVGIKFEVSGN